MPYYSFMEKKDLTTQHGWSEDSQWGKSFSIADLIQALASENGESDDRIFDWILPTTIQQASKKHWTSIKAIKEIAIFLKDCDQDAKFLDIGSGCGKVCLLLSLISKMHFYGIEQRQELYAIAEEIKLRHGLTNVHFTLGNMLSMDWSLYDIYYLYNPFQEHITNAKGMRIDDNLTFDSQLHAKYTAEVFEQLSTAKVGKKLITYHGYGGVMPDNWRLIRKKPVGTGILCLWENF